MGRGLRFPAPRRRRGAGFDSLDSDFWGRRLPDEGCPGRHSSPGALTTSLAEEVGRLLLCLERGFRFGPELLREFEAGFPEAALGPAEEPLRRRDANDLRI